MSLAAPRILHLFANYKWTGPADPAIRAAARLRARGLDVVFAQGSFVHPGGEHRIAEELWRCQLPVLAGLELRKHFHLGSLLRDVRTLHQRLRREPFDVLHCHQPADHLIAALALRKLPRPPVLVRSLYEPEPPRRGFRERAAFRRTAAVLAPTPAAQRGVVERFRLAADRVLLLEPVTEPRQLDGPNARAPWGLQPRHRVVGITARIQPHRRFDLLWDTARAVADRLPEVRFVLLGRGNDEDTRTLVTEPIERLGLREHVLLPGYQKGPAYEAALRALDAFLFLVPGSDGTCRAVCDAMAFGVPVVTTRRGMLPALVTSPRPGELPGIATDETPTALAGELLVLLGDEAVRRQRAAAALRRTQLDMDPARAAQRTEALYRELLAAPARGP
ncbi:MAG: glycosyltransferase family 4 protein [Planctomycetes bacterium]|jgi:glycosyltransferase involved in cell wall biosynthesis|nr:glycosyltransferase family 4 protein [Planctomycetota bacterium]